MSNVFSPFGFRPTSTSNGPENFRISERRIAASNSTAIYKGDAVINIVGPATGYIAVATATLTATSPIAGIFWGCKYLSVSQKREVWSQYWPGSDASGDVMAYVIDDPNARFVVQTSGTSFQISGTTAAFGSSPVGQYAQLANNGGSTLTQQSGMYLNSVNTTATFPFIITNMVLDPPGANGTDPTSQYNYVEVGFNNEWLRSNSAVTGIA